jgi:hypothetical protein
MSGQITVRRNPCTPSDAFDYSQLAKSIETPVREEVQAIRRLMEQGSLNSIQIGLRLQFVRARIGRDHFQAWLKAEFSWTQSVASKYMCVARVFGDNDQLEGFQASALYLLARRKTSPEARKEAIRLASQGEFITKTRALQIISRVQPAGRTQEQNPAERFRRQVERAIRRLPKGDAARILDALLREVRATIDS